VLEQGGWECLSLPTEYEGDPRKTSIGWSDPRREVGELLWPEGFPETAASEAKRTLGSFAFSAQHQQRPVPASGGIWKREWFRRYRRVDRPVKFDMIVPPGIAPSRIPARRLQKKRPAFDPAIGAIYAAPACAT
jgi:hypothetical protein